jgi:hypothetical protein
MPGWIGATASATCETLGPGRFIRAIGAYAIANAFRDGRLRLAVLGPSKGVATMGGSL